MPYRDVSERRKRLYAACEGIELTEDIKDALRQLALVLSIDVDTLCDLFGRLRRGAMPEIKLDEPFSWARCRAGFVFTGDDTEDALRNHDKFCPVCEPREQTA